MTEREPIIGEIRGNEVWDGVEWIARGMEFRIGETLLERKQMVEVWIDGTFVAGIYPSRGENVRHEWRNAIKIVSKYFEDYCTYTDGESPSAMNILLDIKQ